MSSRNSSILLTFCLAFTLWLILSAWNVYLIGYYDPIRLLIGLIASLIVALTMHELLISGKIERPGTKILRYISYSIWEFYNIILAAIDVSLRILGFKDINPQLVDFTTSLRSDVALTTLGNSITLTPGTITIEVDPETGRFLVHAIAPESALLLPIMSKKVSQVFMEGAE